MLVSGGQILAIDHVATNSQTITGDGTSTLLGVNTDTIATKEFTSTYVGEVSGKLYADILETSAYVNTVSGNLQSKIDEKIDESVADLRYMHVGVLSAGFGIDSDKLAANIIEVSATSKSVTQVIHDKTLSGDGSSLDFALGVKMPENMQDGSYYAYDQSGELTEILGLDGKTYSAGDYIHFSGENNEYINVSGLQPLGDYLSANALDNVSGVWNQVSVISGYGYSAWSAVSSYDLSEFITSSHYSAGPGIMLIPANEVKTEDSTGMYIATSGYGIAPYYSIYEEIAYDSMSGVSAGEILFLIENLDIDGYPKLPDN